AIEGYGLNHESLKLFSEKGVKLIITVDCGISNIEEVDYARQLGIDVIITDHHEPSEQLPAALAILNPKIKESEYPFKNLAGVGVTIKLMQGFFYSYHPDYQKEFSIVDIETTGFNPGTDEIIEIGAYKVKNNLVVDRFHRLIKPGRRLSEEIIEITGITDELLSREGDTPDKVIREFLDFFDGSVFVAHNAGFDWSFLEKSLRKFTGKKLEPKIMDTVPMIRSQLPGLSSLKLQAVADYLKINAGRYHRAMNDVDVLFRIFVELRRLRYPAKIDVFRYLDLVSLGTIADMVPLTSENRVLAALGLTKVPFTKNLGLQTLYSILNLDKKNEIAEDEIGWQIAPILNAAGRMETGDISLKLLLTKDKAETKRIAEYLLELNQRRKELTEENLNLIQEEIKRKTGISKENVIIVKTDKIEHGVTGILATKIKNKYFRPTVIMIENEDFVTGAARSVSGLNIIEILREVEGLLIQFGGHEYAAGFTLKKDKADEFINEIKKLISKRVTKKMLQPVLNIDLEIEFEKITKKFFNELDYLRPFGIENERPVFLTRDAEIVNFISYGRNKEHLKLRLRKKNRFFNAIGWNMGEFIKHLSKYRELPVDIVYTIQRSDHTEKNEIILVLEDIKYGT
ncbi:MAG TPA: single-stranded-DNA-specific exonuclease RecJ, partial [Firmicutes bacterium]|nr:single-stranded-DNA-specific exonuclease RecJ [Bacillota bacterium]